MNATEILATVLAEAEHRRAERRRFLRFAGSSLAAAGAMTALAACGSDDEDEDETPAPTPTPTPPPAALGDNDILNFALNLEYLEAQFYSFAATGAGLASTLLTGTGTPGAVTGGRGVTFTDQVVAQYAREIAADEVAHVAFLRRVLGTAAVSQPAINISGEADGPFSAAARAAGIAVNGAFNPYASDENFLLGAFIFEDVGVTAYKGAAPLLASPTVLEASAGLLAAEAYHAGLIRTALYAKGIATPTLRTAANAISDARDSLDGTTDLDQGITRAVSTTETAGNIVPADGNGIAFSRSPAQVLNIVYLTKASATLGGFFPAGVNGSLRTSAAN